MIWWFIKSWAHFRAFFLVADFQASVWTLLRFTHLKDTANPSLLSNILGSDESFEFLIKKNLRNFNKDARIDRATCF